jgi:hypothetical protein
VIVVGEASGFGMEAHVSIAARCIGRKK